MLKNQLTPTLCQRQGNRAPECFKRVRDLETKQECFLIGLLQLKYNIICERPYKFKIKSLPFFKVKTLYNVYESIDVQKLTNERVKSLVDKDRADNVDEKTIRRRTEVYRISEHLHVLMDILISNGTNIKTKKNRHTTMADRRNLYSINYEGINFSKKEIVEKGGSIHSLISEEFTKKRPNSTSLLPLCDTEIMSLLLN
ncbi:hypothetical protein KM1_221080 [Entamoeba histolytica HM-3:IMSS]|uniref:Uncharacterized protein n=2 Tax=Entamoeba histolytica TaxID=5759 RepID=M2S3R8_ENTHI|nr:Hypothetical protein EHI5A_100190 [Entamoeba histolytica KU27]EMS11117.1 hypothetical protein KM1_221080 [Entamoeba histolytica HM-3:IMSS]